MRRLTRLRVLMGVSALLAGVSGCSSPGVCAGVGVVSQVGVFFVEEGYGDLAGASYELCTRGECARGELTQEGISNLHLPLPDDVDPDTAPVRFKVTREGATTPFIDESVEVRLLHQSDGCGGGGYSRGLAYTKEDGLMKSTPDAVFAAWIKQHEEQATALPTALPTDATTTPSVRPPDRTAAGTPTG
ncbi:hypothetical protein [Streptomyces sp. NPDC096132]|uniref:hypothetical protein n=1 Tax=Streptomyces sp. NPDC096132 TaxID=3366075 RepID=UPI0038290930